MPEQMREALEGAGLSRRAAMEKAFDDLSGEGSGSESTSSGSGAPDTSANKGGVAAGGEKGGSKVVWSGEKSGEKPVVDTGKSKQPVREASGKQPVVPKPGSEAKVEVKPGEQKTEGADGKPQVRSKAPGSWKPEERELWESVPENVRAIITRREGEMARALNDSAAARRWAGDFGKIVGPYEHLIRSAGVTPMQAVQNLVNTAAQLQTGTAAQKVHLIGTMIKTYGVDIAGLDHWLAGKQPPKETQQNDGLLQEIDKRLRPVQEFMGRLSNSQRQSEQELAQASQTEAEQFFSDPENEFAADLKDDMADILELAANRGREMTLKQAYDIACSQHPDIAKVINQRSEAARTAKEAENLARSRRAASSQSAGTPGSVGGSGGRPANRREAIAQAWEDLSSR